MAGAMQQVLEHSLLQVARQVEDQLDAELHALDKPLGEDDLEAIRRRRVDEMKRMQQKRAEWAARGHGELSDVDEKGFFAASKGTERLVAHFYRDNNLACAAMDRHLRALAAAHLETRFVRVHAEKAPFLTERLRVWMLPTLAIVKDGKAADYVVGLDELGGRPDFTEAALAVRLAAAGALFEDAAARPPPPAAERRAVRRGGARAARGEGDEDSDFDD